MALQRAIQVSVLSATIRAATAGETCSTRPTKHFFTTGEMGDQPGMECLACPTQPILGYIKNPNNHLTPLSEAERFVLEYWAAMSRGDYVWMMDNYAATGLLTRAGGPTLSGNRLTTDAPPQGFDPYMEYSPQNTVGGLNYWWYAQFVERATWQGTGGIYSRDNFTNGLHVAIQDTVQISEDFALVTAMINGTIYRRKDSNSGAIMAPWQSGKATLSVKKFPMIGWKIVQFTCSFLSTSFVPELVKCLPGLSTGIPPPHVDWTASKNEWAVKFTDQADYCSTKCLCGQAPVAKMDKPCGGVPATLPYQNNFFIEPDTTGVQSAAQPSRCQPCPTAGFTPSFPVGSPEKFALDYLKAMAENSPKTLEMYDDYAAIIRNGGPMITGVQVDDSNGKAFFTEIWPGLSWTGESGAWQELGMTVHRSQRLGDDTAQVHLFSNGTLYDKTGSVVVPWLAKKVVITVSDVEGEWKVVNVAFMDYNTNGVSRCTSDWSESPYCFDACPCGEVELVPSDVQKIENTVYHPAQRPQQQQQQQIKKKHLRSRRRRNSGDGVSMLQIDGVEEGMEEEYLDSEL